MSFTVRNATPADVHFVMHSWLDSYRTAHAAGMIQMSDWESVMMPQLAKILARPGVAIIVAANPDNAGTRADIYGWICHESGLRRPLVHYIYVKEDYRNRGVARLLMRKAGIDPATEFLHTCKTGVLSKLRQKIPHARWSPLLARFERKHPPLKDSNARQESPQDRSRDGRSRSRSS